MAFFLTRVLEDEEAVGFFWTILTNSRHCSLSSDFFGAELSKIEFWGVLFDRWSWRRLIFGLILAKKKTRLVRNCILMWSNLYITVVEYVYHCISTVYQSIPLCISSVYKNVYKSGG